METNNIDEIVRGLLKSRTIQPSNSAWERLSNQLDTVPQKKKRNWFLYIGYAAGILLLISVAFVLSFNEDYFSSSNKLANNVITDSTKLIKPIVEKSTKKPSESENVLVASNQDSFKEVPIIKMNYIKIKTSAKIPLDVADLGLKIEKKEVPVVKKESNSRIKINSEDLLASVTDDQEIYQKYYAQYHVNRDELLRTIQQELDEQSLDVDANTLLAEVEKSVDEETFKKSFIKLIKGEFRTLATSLANRND
ncbi:hypothetical protein QVZ41_06480 [Wenyingzhuangia sp. chi5]|uniref:Anti-sigma factor n=1 Tax=Wenyingzhuangia gilva TaxID=3057677 RepID=A0ABT8VR94_9FLAO|nr:hypothetical protein [Wenyingzhuangia sp. chi5]MDO3694491.1 hypothetical protein [Wenyingzhuangia sp. chi5]